MSRKKRNRPCSNREFYGCTYWQSANYPRMLFNALHNQVVQLALTRFKWINLPETCDERFLELTLFWGGAATIAHPKSQPGVFYSTQVAQVGKPNIYNNPSKWRSIGNNGWHFDCSPANGVVIYDNMTRLPMIPQLDLYVRELVDIMHTKQMNRMHSKVPYLVVTPQDMELTAINTIKQVLGGEPAVLATEAIRDIDVTAIQTNVPYLGQELTAEEMNVWNRIYTLLGIQNLTFKAERQIEDEVRAFAEPTDLMALSPLTARREAVRKLNERFDLDIHVVWRQDNESENYNSLHNINDLRELAAGNNGGFYDANTSV